MSQATICLIIFGVTLVLFMTNKFPLWTVALASTLAMCITGCITPETALAGFANGNTITMASMFVVAAGLNRTQMISKLSGLAYKVSGGSFTKGLAGYVLVTFVIAQVVPSASTVFIICYPLAAAFCRTMNVSPSKAMFAIALTAIAAIGTLPVGAGAVSYLQINGFLETYGFTGISVSMFDQAISRIPMIIAVMIYGALLAPKFAPDRGALLEETQGKGGSKAAAAPALDPVREVIGYTVFFAVVLLLLTSGIHPLSTWEVCLGGASILIFTGVLNEKEALGSILLSPVLLFVGSLAIGAGLVGTGAGEIVSGIVMKLLGENPGGLYIGTVFFVISFVFTQLMSNMALYNTLVPVAFLTCGALGYNPVGVVFLCFIGCFTAYLTPMATITVPLVMSVGGYDQKDLLKMGWIPALLTGIISIPWCMFMFPV